MKTSYCITQTGPIKLTENLGSDPAFKIPVKITCKNKATNKKLEQITGIYYHASEGWVPCNDDGELSILDTSELYDNISRAIDDLGATVLARVFRIADALYNQNPAFVANALLDIDLKPVKKVG